MKVVVVGGTGLIGRGVVRRLQALGQHAIAASPTTGVNTVTRVGLAAALERARVVVDLVDVPTYDPAAALEYLERSTRNLLRAEANAGVLHHVGVSVVGADRLPHSGYMRAKVAQEQLVRELRPGSTILHSTQSFEAMRPVADGATRDGVVRVSPALVQPVAAADISATLASLALREPDGHTFELAGPDRIRLVDVVDQLLAAQRDPRPVEAAPDAPYLGSVLDDRTLVASDGAWIGSTHFDEWVQRTIPAPLPVQPKLRTPSMS